MARLTWYGRTAAERFRGRAGIRELPEVGRLLRDGAAHWLGFYSLVACSWLVLLWISVPPEDWGGAIAYGLEYWAALCRVDPGEAGFIPLFGMWGLMAAAMMLPTLVPALRTYDHLRSAGAGGTAGFALVVAGYLAVWIAFAAAAAGGQLLLHGWLASSPGALVSSSAATAFVLLLAGLYQFAPAKRRLLWRCQNPLTMFMARWRADGYSELEIGVRLGADCLGCCWVLMCVALASGTMNLAWMALATLAMVSEKHPVLGPNMRAPLGVAFIAGSAGLLALNGI